MITRALFVFKRQGFQHERAGNISYFLLLTSYLSPKGFGQ